MIAHGWQLFYFKLFKAALDELEQTITKLAEQKRDRIQVASEDAAVGICLQSSHANRSRRS